MKSVTLVDIDANMTNLAASFPILTAINNASFHDPRVTVINEDASTFIHEDGHLYGAVIIDMPDPDTIDLTHVYSLDFYQAIKRRLIREELWLPRRPARFSPNRPFYAL